MEKKPIKKARSKKYEKKLAVNATFDEVIDLALSESALKKVETKQSTAKKQ